MNLQIKEIQYAYPMPINFEQLTQLKKKKKRITQKPISYMKAGAFWSLTMGQPPQTAQHFTASPLLGVNRRISAVCSARVF